MAQGFLEWLWLGKSKGIWEVFNRSEFSLTLNTVLKPNHYALSYGNQGSCTSLVAHQSNHQELEFACQGFSRQGGGSGNLPIGGLLVMSRDIFGCPHCGAAGWGKLGSRKAEGGGTGIYWVRGQGCC